MIPKTVFDCINDAQLGVLSTEPQRLFGGSQHHVWGIFTVKKGYCLKILGATLASKTNMLEHLEKTERLAQQLYLNGIPAVSAIPNKSGHFICHTGTTHYLLYPWIPSKIICLPDLREHHLIKIASTLADLHNAYFKLKINHTFESFIHTATTKPSKYLPQISQVDGSINKLHAIMKDWESAYLNIAENLFLTPRMSHANLDPRNVLWDQNDNCQLIDWEWAGLTDPATEALGYALEWSGIVYSSLNIEHVELFFSTYVKHASKVHIPSAETLFWGWIGLFNLPWIKLNIERAKNSEHPAWYQAILEHRLLPFAKRIDHQKHELINMINTIIEKTNN